MKVTDFSYPSAQAGAKIHTILWEPDTNAPVLGIIQIAHGMTEYIRRYRNIASFFVERGYIVVGNDHLGHGDSIIPGCKPMYFGKEGSWADVVNDMHTLHGKMRLRYPDLPCYLIGFSLGSFLSRDYMSRYPNDFQAVVLAGTGQYSALDLFIAEKIAKREVKKYGSQNSTPLIHKLTFESYNKHFQPERTEIDWLCENKAELDRYLADPKRGKSMSASMFLEFVHGMEYAGKKSTVQKMDTDVPILLVSGKSDPVGDFGKGVEKVQKLFREAGMNTKLHLYEGRHDILREKCAKQVLADIESFFAE